MIMYTRMGYTSDIKTFYYLQIHIMEEETIVETVVAEDAAIVETVAEEVVAEDEAVEVA